MIVLNPLFGLLYFVCLGLDIVMFFMWIHILLSWRRIRWLVPLGQIGGPLIETLIRSVDVYLRQRLNLHFKRRSLVCLVFVAIFLVKLLVTCLLRN